MEQIRLYNINSICILQKVESELVFMVSTSDNIIIINMSINAIHIKLIEVQKFEQPQVLIQAIFIQLFIKLNVF